MIDHEAPELVLWAAVMERALDDIRHNFIP